nr:hypothetical protein [uncultured Actinoplanes sp.]
MTYDYNLDVFRTHPVFAVAALLPDEDYARKAATTLGDEGPGGEGPQLLHGEEGLRILDQRGSWHGTKAWWHRLLEEWTYYEQIMSLYAEGLRHGECLILLPVAHERRVETGRVLAAHGGHAIYYFGRDTVEQITGP